MLLFHATAVLAAVALIERGIVHARIGIASAFGFVIAAALFATDLTLRHYAGHRLFPFAAPTGGTLLIASWLALAVASAWPRAVTRSPDGAKRNPGRRNPRLIRPRISLRSIRATAVNHFAPWPPIG